MNVGSAKPDTTYPRDLIGYGPNVPHAQWPRQARIAVQFVLNYEEGAENSVLHGDPGSEQFLSEMFNPASFSARHQSMETLYEYGSRVGVWRILREFESRQLPLTVFGVSMALQRHPELTAAFKAPIQLEFDGRVLRVGTAQRGCESQCSRGFQEEAFGHEGLRGWVVV